MQDPNELRKIKLKDLRGGPIRHESLPPEILIQIRAVYDTIGPYLNTTLEQFEVGFMREGSPQREVTILLNIATAWKAYHKKYLNDKLLPRDEERKLIGVLVAMSTGTTDLMGLSVEVGRRLFECYTASS